MRFKLDENLPAELLAELRQAGHEADSVQDEDLAGSPDPIILQHARAEGRILLTMDKGVGDLRAYAPSDYPGIVLFRPPTAGRGAALAFARQHLPTILQLDLQGRLLVVTGAGIRTR